MENDETTFWGLSPMTIETAVQDNDGGDHALWVAALSDRVLSQD